MTNAQNLGQRTYTKHGYNDGLWHHVQRFLIGELVWHKFSEQQ